MHKYHSIPVVVVLGKSQGPFVLFPIVVFIFCFQRFVSLFPVQILKTGNKMKIMWHLCNYFENRKMKTKQTGLKHGFGKTQVP